MDSIFLVLAFTLFSAFLVGQKRFDSLLVHMDKRWNTNMDSSQIIISTYSGDSSWDWKVTAIYQDLSGKWHGSQTETLSKSKGQKSPIDKRIIWEENNHYILTPKTNWTDFVKYLLQLKIETLPNMNEIEGLQNLKFRGGSTHTITFRNSKLNRTVTYDSPHSFRRKHWQVKNAIKLINIDRRFNKETKRST